MRRYVNTDLTITGRLRRLVRAPMCGKTRGQFVTVWFERPLPLASFPPSASASSIVCAPTSNEYFGNLRFLVIFSGSKPVRRQFTHSYGPGSSRR